MIFIKSSVPRDIWELINNVPRETPKKIDGYIRLIVYSNKEKTRVFYQILITEYKIVGEYIYWKHTPHQDWNEIDKAIIKWGVKIDGKFLEIQLELF